VNYLTGGRSPTLFSHANSRSKGRSKIKARHLLFWSLLFVAFPLASMPSAFLTLAPERLITLSSSLAVDVFIPKAVVFIVLWLTGVSLVLPAWRARAKPLTATKPHLYGAYRHLSAPLSWLAGFLVVLTLTSLFNHSHLQVVPLTLGHRFENLLAILVEMAWYSVVFIAGGLVCSRVLPSRLPLTLMVCGATALALLTLLEAAGLAPMPFGADAGNVSATMGHQGYVAAFLGVALVVWTSWKLLSGRIALADCAVTAILSAALVASGGRAGLLAAVIVLLAFAAALTRHKRRHKGLLVVGLVMLVAATATVLTLPHAQQRLQRLGTAVEGMDPAVNHRLIYWQVAVKAIYDRPLFGHGVGALSRAAWQLATPQQADALILEFLPDSLAQDAVRIGNLAFYREPLSRALHVKIMRPFKVHNYFLDLALASGLPALLAFTGFVLSSCRILYRAKTPLTLAVLLGLATYLLYGMVWFATLNVDPIIWGLLGAGLGSAALTLEAKSRKLQPEPR
jgi:O-antigen ligase